MGLSFEPEFLTDVDAEHQHDETVSSCSVKFEGELMVGALNEWIRELIITKGADLFRYKGVLACKGMKRKFVFQGVGMLFAGGFSEIEWEDDEPRECRFVFIGRNLEKKKLIDGVMECKIEGDGSLRFKVGDKVKARTGNTRAGKAIYTNGTIMALWSEGNPYRIKLDTGEEVWC